MRAGIIIASLIVLLCVPKASAEGGITVSPARLDLVLEKGVSLKETEFKVINNHKSAISLTFGFEPATYLHISQTEVTLSPGQEITQKVTLEDNKDLAPGSSIYNLVITQTGGNVLPSIRLPVTVVKKDGAVAAMAITNFSAPILAFNIPSQLEPAIKNTGNIVTIPHGIISIIGPGGKVVERAALNTSSKAIAPGGGLTLATDLSRTAHAWLPGIYRAELTFGLGGGAPTQTVSRNFLYLAWWHVITIMFLALIGSFVVKYTMRHPKRVERITKTHIRKPVLIGRDIT